MELENVSLNVKTIVSHAAGIYGKIKDLDVEIVKRGIRYDYISLNSVDKRCLSLVLALLSHENGAKEQLDALDITLDHVLERVAIDEDDVDIKEIISTSVSGNLECYKKYFEPCLQQISPRYFYVCSEQLLYSISSDWGSIVGDYLLDKTQEKYATLSSYSYKEFMIKSANRKMMQYLEEHEEAKKRYEEQKEQVPKNFLSSLFGGSHKTSDSNIMTYGSYLTEEVYSTDPAVGREKEIEKVEVSLLSAEHSPIIVGPGGVGKTAIVEGLAYRIQQGDVPDKLKDKKIFMLNVSKLVSGCQYVGMFEERVERVLEEIEKQQDVILFVDEMHTSIGAGAGSNSTLDFANILKPYLGRGKIKLIGATTVDEYEQYILSDPAFKRRFQRVNVAEPKEEDLYLIMDEVIKKYEQSYQIPFSFSKEQKQKILNQIACMTQKAGRVYSDQEGNPSLSISIIELAFSYAIYHNHQQMEIDDILEAMMSCDRIYDSAREKNVSMLRSYFASIAPEVKNYQKIISFPKK